MDDPSQSARDLLPTRDRPIRTDRVARRAQNAGQTTTNRGQEMIKKQLDKLMVPRFTGGAMIVAFLFGYVVGVILL